MLPNFKKKRRKESMNFIFGGHFAPHDIEVHEFSSGITRRDKARDLGINFQVTPKIPVLDGIEAVRSAFSHMYIDETRCDKLIKALENYRQEYDEDKKTYKQQILHNWASHGSDCMRYAAINLPRTQDTISAQDLDKLYREAHGLNQPNVRYY